MVGKNSTRVRPCAWKHKENSNPKDPHRHSKSGRDDDDDNDDTIININSNSNNDTTIATLKPSSEMEKGLATFFNKNISNKELINKLVEDIPERQRLGQGCLVLSLPLSDVQSWTIYDGMTKRSLRLVDFGRAQLIHEAKHVRGTEIFDGMPCSTQADAFAVGCTIQFAPPGAVAWNLS